MALFRAARVSAALAALAICCAVRAGAPCAAHWSDAFPPPPAIDRILSAAVFDDGAGPRLYCARDNGVVVKWDGLHVTQVGATLSLPAITSIIVFDDDGPGSHPPALYISGNFDLGGADGGRIARWNGSAWVGVGGGVGTFGDFANALALFDDDAAGPHLPALYIVGNFTTAGAAAMSAQRIARWDGLNWSAVAGGLTGVSGNSLAVWDDDGAGPHTPALFVGGSFTMAGATPAANIAKFDGVNWSALGSGVSGSLTIGPIVLAIAPYAPAAAPARLIVGGAFTTAGAASASGIAQWDGMANWTPIGSPGAGISGGSNPAVLALDQFHDDLYVGGRFTSIAGVATTNVARFHDSGADALGVSAVGGSGSGATGTNSSVNSLSTMPPSVSGVDDTVEGCFGRYTNIGGKVTTGGVGGADGTNTYNFARGLDNTARNITLATGKLWVGGDFDQAGDVPTRRLAFLDPYAVHQVSPAWSGASIEPLNQPPGNTRINQIVADVVNGQPALALTGLFPNLPGAPTAANAGFFFPGAGTFVAMGTGLTAQTRAFCRTPPDAPHHAGSIFVAIDIPGVGVMVQTPASTVFIAAGNGLAHVPASPPLQIDFLFYDGENVYALGNQTETGAGQPAFAASLLGSDGMWHPLNGLISGILYQMVALHGDLAVFGAVHLQQTGSANITVGLYNGQTVEPIQTSASADAVATAAVATPHGITGEDFEPMLWAVFFPSTNTSQLFVGDASHVDGIGEPIQGQVLGIEVDYQVMDSVVTPSVWVVGNFLSAGGVPSQRIARLILCPHDCPGDANFDARVDFLDLNLVLSYYGQPVGANTNGDVNGDGVVDFLDLNIVLSAYGAAC